MPTKKDIMLRAKLEIRGRVQGVGYRYFTQDMALKHGVNGWVKNLGNGNVAALIEGEQNAVERLIACCHQGPPRATVEHIEIIFTDFSGDFISFEILR
jgi:acylphosphatase